MNNQRKIEILMAEFGLSYDEARAYLFADCWSLSAARESIEIDRS